MFAVPSTQNVIRDGMGLMWFLVILLILLVSTFAVALSLEPIIGGVKGLASLKSGDKIQTERFPSSTPHSDSAIAGQQGISEAASATNTKVSPNIIETMV
jgi:hypothetical protein